MLHISPPVLVLGRLETTFALEGVTNVLRLGGSLFVEVLYNFPSPVICF